MIRRYINPYQNIIVLSFLFLNPIVSYSGFLITLKNDRVIYTEHYLVEGDKIALYLKSGTITFSKDEIKSIVEAKGEIEEDHTEVKKGDKKEVSKEDTLKSSDKTLDQKKTEMDLAVAEKEIESYKKRKKETQKRLDEAKKAYVNASNKDEKYNAEKVMLSISKELFELQDQVKEKNKGNLPTWWQED
jgi:hypothetical protein